MSSAQGWVHERYEPVRQRLDKLLDDDPDYGVQFAVFADGALVVSLWAGTGVSEDTVFPIYSSSKGLAAICLAMLVDAGRLDPKAPVTDVWPEFATAGKTHVTIEELFSHQAGLPWVEGGFRLEELCDGSLAARLARQEPLWRPGFAHGYHALTIGSLIEEVVLRVTGRRFADVFRTDVASPTGADAYFGLPPDLHGRLGRSLPPARPDTPAIPVPTLNAYSLDVRDLQTPGDLIEIANHPRVVQAGPAAVGGVASARGMATAFNACMHAVGAAPRLLSAPALAEAARVRASGLDIVLGVPNSFGLLFAVPDRWLPFAGAAGVGHGGYGGSLGFADPEVDIAVGYITRRAPSPTGADARSLELADCARWCHMG